MQFTCCMFKEKGAISQIYMHFYQQENREQEKTRKENGEIRTNKKERKKENNKKQIKLRIGVRNASSSFERCKMKKRRCLFGDW